MEGLVIPCFTRDTFSRIFLLNADKNYLTPLELAAIADNHLLTPTVDGLAAMLSAFSIECATPEAQAVLAKAVRLTLIYREEL